MIKMTQLHTGEHAGGYAIIISDAEATMLSTLAFEQQIQEPELLTRLITNATISTAGKLAELKVVK